MNSIYQNTSEEKKLANRIFLEELYECEKFPKYFEIEPIDICNARCYMCRAGQHKGHSGNVMTMDLFEKIIEQIQPYAKWIEMIALTGRGESLLDKTLELKIKKLRDIGIKQIQLSTNAALLNEERVERLFESGLNDLRFSIDSVQKDIYEKIRGLKFDDVIKNTERAIEIRNKKFPTIPIRIRAVELPENEDERRSGIWQKFWDERLSDIDIAHFLTYVATQAGVTSDIDATYPCIAPFSTMIIRSMGQVDFCCVDFTYGQFEVGNIQESSIIDVWRGEKFRSMRKLHLERNRDKHILCRGCTAWGETI